MEVRNVGKNKQKASEVPTIKYVSSLDSTNGKKIKLLSLNKTKELSTHGIIVKYLSLILFANNSVNTYSHLQM